MTHRELKPVSHDQQVQTGKAVISRFFYFTIAALSVCTLCDKAEVFSVF